MAYDWENSKKIGIVFSKQQIKCHIYGMLDDGTKLHIGKWSQDGSRYKALLYESAYLDEENEVANEYIANESKAVIEEDDDIPF